MFEKRYFRLQFCNRFLRLCDFEIASEPLQGEPCRPRDANSFGLGLSYRPTPANLMSFGGEDGYPGSRIQFECNEAKAASCGYKNILW